MKQLFRLSGKRFAGAGLIALGLLISSAAFASIVSGLSTTGSSSNVTISNLPLTKPSDVAVGDLMLASIAIHDGNTVTVTPPTGWTEVLRTDNDSNIGIDTYEKIATASEPSNYTWVLSPQTRAQGGITRYSGVDPIHPLDVSSGNSGRSKIATSSSVTTTAANDQIVTVYALHVGSSNYAGNFFSTPSGMTEKYDSSYATAGPTIASFDATQATSGVTGTMSSTISGGTNQQRDWAAHTIALRMQSTSTLSNGLLDYYKLNGNSADAFGSNNGTDHNSPTYSTTNGISNQGVGFNGTNQYITANSINPSTYDSGLSISAWFKPASTSYGVPFNLTQSGVCDTQIIFDGSHIDYRFIGSNEHDTGVSYSSGNWYHIIITHNGSTEKMYVNGILQSTDTGAPLANCSTSLGLGAGIDAGNIWTGAVDEVGVWGREVSQSDVTSLYNSGAGNSYPF